MHTARILMWESDSVTVSCQFINTEDHSVHANMMLQTEIHSTKH